MKISRKVGLILGAVILIAALVVVGMFYFQQAGERNDLKAKLSAAQNLSDVLAAQKKTLENQLAQAQLSLDTSRAKIPQSVESIEYGEYLFEIADECNVNLASLNFPKPTNKKVGAVTYSVVSLSLPISGALTDIFAFIDVIRTDERFASAAVTGIDINIAGSATIKIDIYGYKG